jgi:S-ribosylhomocysteine lyase
MSIKTGPDNRSTELAVVTSKVPESLSVDHRKITSPQIKQAGVLTGPAGDKVSKFEFRFVQPNHDALPTAAIHTLEHLLSAFLRDRLKGIINFSPMACRTGFYLIIWGEPSIKLIKSELLESLEQIISCEEDDVPRISEKECGNYRDHSLNGAKEYARKVLEFFRKE